jgi:A/G-specific adenine glycosylase
LAWYAKRKRALPWRRSLDPYAVWVSEMMLQQTQVATVIPYFDRWMERFPDVATLSSAAESDVLHAWQGLGYYSRARNLRRAATTIVQRHAGKLPASVEELRALPGIGPYSAGAIASIAFGKHEPLVDGNVIRVLTRLFARRGDPSRAPLKAELWELAGSLVRSLEAQASPGDFNQALMELGATVCTPRAPRCELCPLHAHCAAAAQNLVATLPELRVRQKPTLVHMVAAIVPRGPRVLLVRQPAHATRWAGMWLFPNVELSASETAKAASQRALSNTTRLLANPVELLCVVRHTVTRFRITLEVYRMSAARGRVRPATGLELGWYTPAELTALAMPAAHRVIANRLARGPH